MKKLVWWTQKKGRLLWVKGIWGKWKVQMGQGRSVSRIGAQTMVLGTPCESGVAYSVGGLPLEHSYPLSSRWALAVLEEPAPGC